MSQTYSIEAEMGLLGAALESDECARELVRRVRTDPVFSDEQNEIIYSEIRKLIEAGKPAELVAIEIGRSHPQLLSHLEALRQACHSTANFSAWFDEVHGLYRRRIAIEGVSQGLNLLHGGADPELVLRGVTAALSNRGQPQLETRRFNPSARPERIRPVYSLGKIPICTPGNLTCITAQAKAGKSALIGAMLASVMTPVPEEIDTFGLASRNDRGLGVLHFDSEQSPDDYWHLVDRALRRAKLTEVPSWLHSFVLTGYSAKECWTLIRQVIVDARAKCGGIHSVLIDGYADLVCDVNDPEECNRFVSELHAIAIENDCAMIGVIHFNPRSEKVRGHLGSQLERKSETNLCLEKDGEISAIYSEKQRRAPILKDCGPRFRWDDSAQMHVSCHSVSDERDKLKAEKCQVQLDDVFSDRGGLRYSEIVFTLKERLKLSQATAERKVSEYLKLGLIKKAAANLYVRTYC